MEEERCKHSVYHCDQCRGRNQCGIRNMMISAISSKQISEAELKKAQSEISSLQGRISSLLNENSSLKETSHKKDKKEEGQKEEVPIGAIKEQEPEVQELISASATASEELGDDECEKKEPNVMTPENHLFEIKCPKCGGFWHDPENNVAREEICKKCKAEEAK
jgi:hypothetical protein